jgi:hypothetical protein
MAAIAAAINIACVMGRITMQQFYNRKTAPNSTDLLPKAMRFRRQITKSSTSTATMIIPLPMIISELYEILLTVSFR